MEQTTNLAIQRAVTVPVSVDRAFSIFADAFGQWWPTKYTWSGDVLERIGIEPFQDGKCFERGPHGFRCDWGRVLVWERPNRIVFTWQISPERLPEPDPERASEVDVRFSADGAMRTRVTLEHRGFERHGERGSEYCASMDSPEGWTHLLNCYAASVH